MLDAGSNKTQKPGAITSRNLPDSRQAARPLRTTRGRAAKKDTTGQFVCIGVHVQICMTCMQ